MPPPVLRKPYTVSGNTLSRPSGSRVAQLFGSHLTERQCTEHAASGKCFGCGETGHFYCNCPRLNSVKGSRDCPPGHLNFNIEVDVGDIDGPSNGAAPVVEVMVDDTELTDCEEDCDNDPLNGGIDDNELGSIDGDHDDILGLAAMCLLYDPGMETDAEDNQAESLDAPGPEGTSSEAGNDEESQEECQSLPSEPGTRSPELVPTRPNTPQHFFYEPNPLPNVV